MANKHNLKIVEKALAIADATVVVNVLGAVPAGKTRFICMVKVNMLDNAAAINGVSIIDGAAVDSATTIVDTTSIAAAVGTTTVAFPDAVDVDNPMFKQAEGRFLNIVGLHADGDGDVTFVYFEE